MPSSSNACAHVEIALARGDDADLGIGAAAGDEAVELVGAGEGEDGRALVVVQSRFLVERLVAEADVEPGGRHHEVFRRLDLHAVDATIDRGGGLDVVLHALDADPDAGEARQGKAEHTVVEDLLHAGRVEHRDHVVDEGELRLVRARRAFAGVVIAHESQHAAVLGGAGVVGVAEDVARAVEARPLAVPDAEHAVVFAVTPELGLLRAPQRRRGEVFVEAGHEFDLVGLEDALGAQHRRLQRGDRRAAVARDVPGRVEPGSHIAGALRQHQAHDRLRAGQQLAGLIEGVFVVEADGMLWHVALALRVLPRGRSPRAEGRPQCLSDTDARVRRGSQTRRAPGRPGMHLFEMGTHGAKRNQWTQTDLAEGLGGTQA